MDFLNDYCHGLYNWKLKKIRRGSKHIFGGKNFVKNEVKILGKCESCGKDVFSNEDYVEILKCIFSTYYCEECFGGQVVRNISK